MKDKSKSMLAEEALQMHASGRRGKLEIRATKPLTTQRDLTLAYSPGVAAPCLEIHRDPALSYEYTARGNIVGVISNGTAVLGLGNIGPLAAKPVMEGKAVLFKRFADIDGINVEVNTQDVDEFVNCVRYLGLAFGGINLEDIKAPECFIIENRLRELLDIPVFHDDQHGTAIVTAAGFINALHITNRDIKKVKVVANGAGAAAIACIELFKVLGVPDKNVIMCDSKGVIYEGRTDGMNQWKSKHANKTKARTLSQALEGADMFLGLSKKGAVTKEMVKGMAKRPIIFAMANPDPEITPEEVEQIRDDAIMATGRSDYPNQINNVLCFPYMFRGALDVRASAINDEMKSAAAHALANLAREDVPDEVAAAYAGARLQFGPEYLIPAPFDPRLIVAVPKAVAKAAMDSGVAQKPIADMDAYEAELKNRLNPTSGILEVIFEEVRANPRRVVFAEGEEEKCIRAAYAFLNGGYGKPVMIGRKETIKKKIKELGLPTIDELEIHNARLSTRNEAYRDFLYKKLQRKGYLRRDCQRMVNQDRNIFAACMVANGDADAMVTGVTRNYYVALDEIRKVLDPNPGARVFGLTLVLTHDRTFFVSDTVVSELPQPPELADIAEQTAAVARGMGHEPKVALISFSNFGNPPLARSQLVREAVKLLDDRKAKFEYDGEMGIDVALNKEIMALYPFCRLTGPANVLIMPGLHSAQTSTKLLDELGGTTMLGPILMGLSKPAQIVEMGATVNDLVTMAVLAAHAARR